MSECAVKSYVDWQVGDTVRCIDSRACSNLLTRGDVYKIRSVDAESSRITLHGVDCQWSTDRFEFVAPEVEPAPVAEPNPYADWKSGDSVRCVDADGSHDLLANNHIYEIENGPFVKSDKDRIRLVGLSGYEWNCERFERVAPIVDVHSEPDKPVVRVGSRVRCDDNSGNARSELFVGLKYTVLSLTEYDGETFIGVDDETGASWQLSRFTVLPDEVAPVVPVVPAKQADQWDEATRGKKMSSATGRVIYKYQMPVMEHFTMQIPAGAEIIRMAGIDGMFWLWAVVDTNAPDEARKFHAVKCGGNMPDIANLKYVGCCAVFVQQELMLYIFEEVSNA